eukprot:NODE_4633_length_782_cov_23.129604_g4290_i0.p1 GENE.NODE_4633_length_782_cov_23.129604_g4290_i0~~NODE_4633_length_782_cov_23.129604_g4290_i0.p1  ORF type:complete len:210 (+),score=36.48 NODE_4633_length_782_cov_23.129604_g4290_i0:55-684(+)
MADTVILYSYWRSSCSWRVRTALALKGVEYEYRPINLLNGDQKGSEYAALNPGLVLPTLIIDGQTLIQSLSILEYLEETRPNPPLLPRAPADRSAVRSLCQMIACDIQPVQNLRVLGRVGPERKMEWGKEVINNGLIALEARLAQTAGTYCFGDSITMADVVLVPQVFNAKRFDVDLTQFPTITRLNEALCKLPAFQASQPSAQPDAVN